MRTRTDQSHHQRSCIASLCQRAENRIFCGVVGLLLPGLVLAAGIALNPPDSNSRLVVENAVVKDGQTTLLFWTYPDLGDPASGKPCPLNFYTLNLLPGLSAAEPQLLAKGVCGSGLTHASLLADSTTIIVTDSSVEHWGVGKKLGSRPFSALGEKSKAAFDPAYGGRLYDIAASGEITLAAPRYSSARDDVAGTEWFISHFDAKGKQTWGLDFSEAGQRTNVEGVWSNSANSTLLRVSALPADASSFNSREYLYAIDDRGSMQQPLQLSVDNQPNLAALMDQGQEAIMQALAKRGSTKPEGIAKLKANGNTEGGFDVLFQRTGGEPGRAGHYLLRLGADGQAFAQLALDELITPYGLHDWFDFYTSGGELVLLSKVSATQPGVQASRTRWPQNVVSWIDLKGAKPPVSKLIPLERRYLQAAMDAGDAQMQFLEGIPGGEPALLTTLAGDPLAVSIGRASRRPALRLNAADDQWLAFTEAFELRQSKLAREQMRGQKKADQEIRNQQFNADMAAAVGMTPEAYAALGNRERKELMIRQGDFDAMQAAANKQTAMAMSQTRTPEGGSAPAAAPFDSQAAINSGMTPEMAAQMQAAMAQFQQVMGSAGAAPPAAPPATPVAAVNVEAFAMQVMDISTAASGALVLSGKIDSGSVAVGDSICLLSAKGGQRALKVEGIERFNRVVKSAYNGDTAGIQVVGIRPEEVAPGDRLQAPCEPGK